MQTIRHLPLHLSQTPDSRRQTQPAKLTPAAGIVVALALIDAAAVVALLGWAIGVIIANF